ncbi:MAG: hypothetical protein ACD_43C00109G0001, partial [uncultured bacterium]
MGFTTVIKPKLKSLTKPSLLPVPEAFVLGIDS